MSRLKAYEKDFLLLLESGFIAVNQADQESAIQLFKAAELLNPKNPLAKIGYGYLYLHKLELKKAIHAFESVLKVDPNNEMAKTFLGIALTFTINEEAKGEKLLANTAKSKDKLIKNLSNTALDFAERFIKQAPPPMQTPKRG